MSRGWRFARGLCGRDGFYQLRQASLLRKQMVQAMHIALVVMTIVQRCGKVFLRWSFTGMIGRS